MNRRERRRQEKARRKAGGPRPEIIPVLDRAYAHQQAGRLEEAVVFYRRALAADPDYGPALNNLGVALKDLGRFEDAEAQHRRALKANPRDPDAAYNLGVLAQARGRTDDAEAHYRQALWLNPDDAAGLSNLGAVLIETGRSADAVELLEKAAALMPDQAETLNNLGAALIEQGRPDDAAAHLRRAIEIDPGYDEAFHNLGAAMFEQGRPEDAIESYARALEINPSHANAQVNLGITLMTTGRADAALEALRRGLAANPANAAARHMVAALSGETTDAAPTEFIETLFDLYARRFDEHLVDALGYRVPALMRETVDRATGNGGGFGRALDLGCGTGLVAESFRDAVGWIGGVDLSPRMVEKARDKGLYDALETADLVEYMVRFANRGETFDLVTAADTFIYLGDLGPVFAAAAAVLVPGGLFAFSLEHLDGEGFRLLPTGRYAHADSYVEARARAAGLAAETIDPVIVRTEHGRPIAGSLFVLRHARADAA